MWNDNIKMYLKRDRVTNFGLDWLRTGSSDEGLL